MELIIAGLAAAAVLLITIGFASRPPKDAVQTRLEQLVVQPKTLEEFELQQPFFERVMRPTIKRLSRVGSRGDQGGMIARTDAKLEKAGYPGGLRSQRYRDLMASKPEEVVRRAVKGMLPKTTLGRSMLTKLKVYAGPTHPHAAQAPAPLDFPSARRQA